MLGFWGCQNYAVCAAPTSTAGSQRRDVVTCWSNPGQMVRKREIRASCVRRSDIPARRWRDAQNWIWCKPRGRWKRPIWKYKQPRTKRSKQHSEWDRRWRKCPRSRNCWRRTWSQPVTEDRSEETFAGRHQKRQRPCGKMVQRHQGVGETTEQQGHHSKSFFVGLPRQKCMRC